MTKQNAAKKAIREYARAHDVPYSVARRRLGYASDQLAHGQVMARFEFIGADAPPPLRLDVSRAMDLLRWADVEVLRRDGWTHDPNRPEQDQLPDLLAKAAFGSDDPAVQLTVAWDREHTQRWNESFTIPDPFDSFETRTVHEYGTFIPHAITFDAGSAEQWIRRHRWVHDSLLIHLVTPAERRAWMDWHHPGSISCSTGQHFWDASPSPYAGECVGCGTLMLVKHNGNGEEYEAIVDEATFFADAVASQAACNWAPPTLMIREILNGTTQADWHERNRPRGQDDPDRSTARCAYPDDRDGEHDHTACLDGLSESVSQAVSDYVAVGGSVDDLAL